LKSPVDALTATSHEGTVGVTPVTFGVNLPNFFVLRDFSRDELLAYAREAEEYGFDSLVVGDHILWHSPVLDPFLVLAAVSAVTRKLRLFVGVYLLPLRHPVPVAKVLTTLAHLAPGRVIFGVGVGGENPVEWEACGVPVAARGARTDEAIQLLRKVISGEPTLESGPCFPVPPITIRPLPQEPIPFWIGGRSRAAMRRAAALGDGWFPHNLTPVRYREAIEQIVEMRRQSPMRRLPVTRSFSLPIFVDADLERARQIADAHVRGNYGIGIDKFERYFALGPIERCRETVRAYLDAGVEHLVLQPLGADPRGQLELLASEILPEFISARAQVPGGSGNGN
jgi:probable F420-dependent oxidoreductase